MFIGISRGETRPGPFSRRMSYWPSSEVTPPMPVPMTTATRVGSRPLSSARPVKPASAHASRAATSAACSLRSSRRAWTRASTEDGSTAIGAPMRTESPSDHSGRATTPDRPSSRFAQYVATSPPRGVVAPRPVTTTSSGEELTGGNSILSVLLDVGDRVADGLELGELVVRDLGVELLLDGHGHLDHGQRVDVEVVDEALVRRDVL